MASNKIIVAIHGMGDQVRNATVQTVTTRFGSHFQYMCPVPLGYFHSKNAAHITARQLFTPPTMPPELQKAWFVEAYWAHVARKAEEEHYTLEETKLWAGTLVGRIRAHYSQVNGLSDTDYELIASVLEEIIEAVRVGDNLLFIAKKAGVFEFDLKKLLDAYLGDVQLVAEFPDYRAEIVEQFSKVMNAVHQADQTAELYVVALSEGTVVSFLGLLGAMSQPLSDETKWIQQVRGYMTFGSPIDKHLVLWPHIWDDFRPAWQPAPEQRIRWRNYYDFGDPVGFKLETARQWLHDNHWTAFDFTAKEDFGFSRYLLPGEAHNDYWQDDEVFGNFIEKVVMNDEQTRERPPVDEDAVAEEKPELPSKPISRVVSWALPYVVSAALLAVAVAIFYNTMKSHPVPGEMVADILGITALLIGVTALARVPVLIPLRKRQALPASPPALDAPPEPDRPAGKNSDAKDDAGWDEHKFWTYCIAVAAFVIGLFLYVLLVSADTKNDIGAIFSLTQCLTAGHMPSNADAATAGVVILACVITALGWLSISFPRLGLRPLMWSGGVMVFQIIAVRILRSFMHGECSLGESGGDQKIGALFLAGGAFLYLWWLGALIFDLTLVWHRYIRRAVALKRMRKWYKHAKPGRRERPVAELQVAVE